MKWTGLNDLREQYLSFFESKGHLRHKSFPLVPINDKSILLINAGMTPLKKYFTGELEPPRHRMTTCQKCIRTPDIERVGITARHGTFFEMLGNFSFGDYFKHEALPWAWEFLTRVLEMPEEKLWATIYKEDDEAYDIWTKEVGLDPSHIVRLGKEDNFWEHGSGPCGPCSEIYFDRGPEYGCGSPDCKPGCDCDRYMEIWNNVFTQFDNDGNNNYTRLEKPNIDTGMGLERLACVMQGVNNLFEVDTVRNIMKSIEDVAGVKYGDSEKTDISLRVITDHIRATTFLVCDGVVPSNEGRGYVLRRLLRRAARHGRLLGINRVFLSDIIDVVARENYSEYPELTDKLDYIKKVVRIEEERFASTIDSGLSILNGLIDEAKANKSNVIKGDDVFRLNDTFGFPIDITREISAEQGISIDEDRFTELMKEQKERARAAHRALGDLGWTQDAMAFIDKTHVTEFTGYTETESKAKVVAIIDGDSKEQAGTAVAGENIFVLLDRTPFYAESGGQVGDTGYIKGKDSIVRVKDTKKHDGVYIQICEVESGSVSVGDEVTATVDRERREAIRRNHSSVHLLQAALRKVLGEHVEQAGSYVDEYRARFDFSHFAPMTSEEISEVERLVNEEILKGDVIETKEMDIESAKKLGAMALFGEKYGDVVRVVKMGDFSTELCGGTHADNTSKIGLFKILSESSVAAGVRRIEGVTGLNVLSLIYEKEKLITETANELKVGNPLEIAHRAGQLQAELKNEKKQVESLNAKLASAQTAQILASAKDVKGIKVVTHRFDDAAPEMPRAICDEFKASDDDIVAVIANVSGGKITFAAACGKNAVSKGAHAGNILKQISAIVGGGGGGRPDSASSGGKDVSKLGEALDAVSSVLDGMIK